MPHMHGLIFAPLYASDTDVLLLFRVRGCSHSTQQLSIEQAQLLRQSSRSRKKENERRDAAPKDGWCAPSRVLRACGSEPYAPKSSENLSIFKVDLSKNLSFEKLSERIDGKTMWMCVVCGRDFFSDSFCFTWRASQKRFQHQSLGA